MCCLCWCKAVQMELGFISASAVLVRCGGLLCELGSLFGSRHCRISRIQTLRHLLADYVHQPLEGLFDVDVVLGTGLKKLKT